MALSEDRFVGVVERLGTVMSLGVADRLLLLQILPKEGSLTTLRLVRAFREELSFSAVEHDALKFKQNGAQIEWDAACPLVKDVEVTPPILKLIRDSFAALDAAGKLTLETLPLYERFLEKVVV